MCFSSLCSSAASSAGMHLPLSYLLAQVILSLKQGYTMRISMEQVFVFPLVFVFVLMFNIYYFQKYSFFVVSGIFSMYSND